MKQSNLIPKSELRAIEFEALIAEIAAISIEVKGMEAMNQYRAHRGEQIAYDEEAFWDKALRVREISAMLSDLAKGD